MEPVHTPARASTGRGARRLATALCLVLGGYAFAADPAVSVGYSPPLNPVPIGSTFVDWETLLFRPTPVGQYCGIFDEATPALEKMEVHVTVLRPGMASHAPHHHPWEELLLVKDGTVEVSINGRRQAAGRGALVFIASHDVHNLRNVGSSPATYYVLNFYTGAVHAVRDQPSAEWAPSGLLTSRVVDCTRVPVTPTRSGFHTEILDSRTVTFRRLESHLTTLNPGEETTPRNRIAGDEIFIVKAGTVQVTLNRTTHMVGPGSLYYVAPNDERTMRNTSDTPATYQVFQVVSEGTPVALGK